MVNIGSFDDPIIITFINKGMITIQIEWYNLLFSKYVWGTDSIVCKLHLNIRFWLRTRLTVEPLLSSPN